MNSQIKLAVASALAVAASQLVATPAMALSPTATQNAFTAGTLVSLYISGATSTDPAFDNLAALTGTAGYCAAGTLDIYNYKSSGGSVKTKVISCTAGFSATGITSGTTPILVGKDSFGGSADGIIQVANHSATSPNAIQYVDISSPSFLTSCAANTSTVGASTDGNFAAYTTHDCGYTSSPGTASTVALTTNIAPDAGVSDVDPATFVGTASVSNANVTALVNKKRTIAVTFNPIVSIPLALAIQKAEGIVTSGATAPDTTSVDKLPSLPAAVVRSIFTGGIQTADQVYLRNPNTASATGTLLSSVLPSSAPETLIHICRRGDTSGSQFTTAMEFMGSSCSKNASTLSSIQGPDNGTTVTSGVAWADPANLASAPYVFAGAGSGDVRSCVAYFSGQGALAVGIVSTESKPSASNFSYTRIDGQAPTLKNVMEGNYWYFAENSFNDTGLTGGKASIWTQISNNIGNPASIAKINSSWQNATQIGVTVVAGVSGIGEGDVGVLDLPIGTSHLPTLPITAASVRTNPINGTTKLGFGSTSPNNCNPGAQAY